jgi:hypothetical protein
MDMLMNSRLLKDVKSLKMPLFAICLLVLMGCKKDVVEVSVDAFSDLNAEIRLVQGVNSLQFTLQEFPYKEVGVKLGTNKSKWYQKDGFTLIIANQVSSSRYGIFFNSLTPNTTYYYQIYVKNASGKEISSDLFSFTTNP